MSVQPQRIYVTGGRGRLASLIADHFRAPTHEVTLFSRDGTHGFKPLAGLTDPNVLSRGQVIFHLAWSSLPATSEQNPGIEAKEDIPLLKHLLEALARQPEDHRAHLVFFSSGGAVYGNAGTLPSSESDPCHPIGSYGRAKLATEILINEYAAQAGLPCTILRISNPYGYPVPKNRAQGLIPHALRCAAERQTLTLWGDGTAKKDFLYYTDFLSALEPIISQQLTGTFNICSGESHSVLEVISLVENEIGNSIDQKFLPAPAWDVHDSKLTPDRLISTTGWRPQVSLAEGIRRASAGYVTH